MIVGPMPLGLVGTRSSAIRRRTSGEGANVKTGEADGAPSLSLV